MDGDASNTISRFLSFSGIAGSLLGLSYSGLANFMSVQRLRWIGSLVMVRMYLVFVFISVLTISPCE